MSTNMINQTIILVILMVVFCLGRVHSLNPKPVQYLNFSQTLDHFGEGNLSKIKFNQKIIIDKTYWGGRKSNGPLLVYFGGESPISSLVQKIWIINQGAQKFKALVLYIEHRFYGDSIPFGNIDIALEDLEVRGCLTSAQALMDFAEIIQTIKKNYLQNNKSVVVFGCSYSGMLAAWFRLKFPHIATGAFASSAPIFFFDMEQPWDNEFFDVVSRDYKAVNEDCYDRIKKSWELIDNIGSQGPEGYEYLQKIFKTCSPFISIEAYFYEEKAQYNGRYNGKINEVCNEIVQAPNNDILSAIARYVTRQHSCIDLSDPMTLHTSESILNLDSQKAWNWQVCSEFIQRQGFGNNTMFQPRPFNLTAVIDYCTWKYHVPPRLNWVSTYYGGTDMRSTLKNFGSNVLFSNGRMDPYSPFGVLEDVSKRVVALTTKKGSHCLDLMKPLHDDPKWLKKQRAKEMKIISKWIKSSQSSNRCQTWFIWFWFTLVFVLLH